MPILTIDGRPLADSGNIYSPSPANIAAPAIVTPPADLSFNMATARPGVPGVNDQFENLTRARDWTQNFKHPTEGFAGIRWQPTWKRADGFQGSWQPAEGEIFKIARKGTTGADLRTLVFTCGPNDAAIPVGDSIVIWYVPSNGGVDKAQTSLALSGYNLPLLSKLTVTASTGSKTYDTAGRRIVEIQTSADLPAIDYTVPTFVESSTTWRRMRMRHWSFYKDASTKAMRHPLGWFCGITIDNIVPNGGYCMLGGLQHLPTWYDWTQDYRNFGATLTEELYKAEQQGLADRLGTLDPRLLAVEIPENESTRQWADSTSGVGYGTLLKSFYYPTARQIWGQERTLVLKATSFGNLDSMRDEFDFKCPTGENAHLATHNYDGQAHIPAQNNLAINWGNIDQTDYYAKVLAQKITDLGYKGGGLTEVGAYPQEWYDYTKTVTQEERGRRMGRILTSASNKGLYTFFWGMLGGDPTTSLDMASIYTIDGSNIEAFRPAMRPYASRSGLTTA
jgi:hypothetical protein